MRIYEIGIEHKQEGPNWRSVKISATTASSAVKKAEKIFESYERLGSIKLLASTD